MLYHQAFRQFGPHALWGHRVREHPALAQALIVADRLGHEGSMAFRPLAARIEAACGADSPLPSVKRGVL